MHTCLRRSDARRTGSDASPPKSNGAGHHVRCLIPGVLLVVFCVVGLGSAGPINSIEEDQPWLTPCSLHRDSVANVPVDIIRGVTIPRIPEWDDPSKFAFETLNVLGDTEDLVNTLTNYMIQHHFGENGSHVSDLSQYHIEDFDIDIDDITGKTMDTLMAMYEGLVKATIFLETMKEDLARESPHMRTQKEEKMAMAMDTLSRGGWDGDLQRESGLYQILCKLYSYLAANGRFMYPSHLDKEVVPSHLRNPKNRAERHNRDFVVLHHMKELFSNLRQAFLQLHKGKRQRNMTNRRLKNISVA